ncbi:phasin family protein [Pseudoduganella aquatica]|uniref:TIGR01841 family phasin n=1 Tax=Pseudoduganella aquatica TaxID=2660641 RepID=A0A7X4HF70_9BURK|nr:phasin family protein [Pseudoduganella aquatica]MYN09035.1 TIGR01841 family phasin [Pseudoduganella aquatica]
MFSFTEQFSAATATAKSQLDQQLSKQLNIASEYATTAFDGVQQIIALNVSTTKASVEKTSAAAKQLFDVKEPAEFFKLNAAQSPSLDSLLAYSRELYNIASRTQAELLEVVKEQIKDVTAAGTAAAAAAAKQLPLASAGATPFSAPVSAPVSAPAPAAAPVAKAAPAPAPVAAPVEPVAAAPAAEAAPATVVTPPAPKAVAQAVSEAVSAPAQEEAPAAKSGKAKPATVKATANGEPVVLKSAKNQK